jgi:hypothetical protein
LDTEIDVFGEEHSKKKTPGFDVPGMAFLSKLRTTEEVYQG